MENHILFVIDSRSRAFDLDTITKRMTESTGRVMARGAEVGGHPARSGASC